MATIERFILLLINLTLANTFALLNIRNTNEDELVKKLIKLIDDEKTGVPEEMNQIDVRRHRKNLHDAHNKYERIKQIKKRDPYGAENLYLHNEDDPTYKALKKIRKKNPLFIKDKNGYVNIGRSRGSLSFSYSHSDSDFDSDSEDPNSGTREGDYERVPPSQSYKPPRYIPKHNLTVDWMNNTNKEFENWLDFLQKFQDNITSTWNDLKNHQKKHGWSAILKNFGKSLKKTKPMLKSGDDDLMALGKRNVEKVMRHNVDEEIKKSFHSFWEQLKAFNNKIKNAFTRKINKNTPKPNEPKPKSLREDISNMRGVRYNKRFRPGLRVNSRSGEEHDPLAPGKVPFNVELHDETTAKANTWLPSYPYWNYWTYEKSLYQDDCPGKTIRVGKWCIKPPSSH